MREFEHMHACLGDTISQVRGCSHAVRRSREICMREATTRAAHLDNREALAQRLPTLLHDLLVDGHRARASGLASGEDDRRPLSHGK